jgi:hypothetical protein
MRRLILPILILAVAVIVVLFIARGDKEPPAPVAVEPELAPPVVVQEPPAPRIRRIDPPVVEEPLPPLSQSDTETWTAASEIFGSPMIDSLLVRSGVIRRIVVTIDNSPRDKIAMRVRAVHATPGRFAVAGEEGDYALSEDNFARYKNLVAWVDGVDAGKVVSLYQRYYPLFQQAYEELGYPGQEFNARVIEVIDDFLTAPAPAGPIPLARPHVLYQYADPDLEGRSAGQKALIRMGSSNAAVIKAKLRQLRAGIIERSR